LVLRVAGVEELLGFSAACTERWVHEHDVEAHPQQLEQRDTLCGVVRKQAAAGRVRPSPLVTNDESACSSRSSASVKKASSSMPDRSSRALLDLGAEPGQRLRLDALVDELTSGACDFVGEKHLSAEQRAHFACERHCLHHLGEQA
jgi:hypothetical protein